MAETMHERMMRLHNPSQNGGKGPGHKGGSRELASYEITLQSKKQIAENTYAFYFDKPKSFTAKAGQHIRMTLIDPPETDAEGNSRFFSLASSPGESQLMIAMRMRDTAFKRVLGSMQIGDKVLIQIMIHSMHGSFTLHDDPSKPAVFLVGGIGIAPAFSMIKDAIERKLPHKIFLFYTNRRPEDAPFLTELKKLAQQHPSFKLITTMTEPEKSATAWRGETGYINEDMLKRYVHNLQAPIYYIAGLPEMASGMKQLLKKVGITEAAMRAEEFAGFNLNDLTAAKSSKGKSRAALIAIVLAIVAMVILHAVAATSVFKIGQGTGFLKNPIVYLVAGFTLGIVVMLKFKLISGFLRSKKKSLGE